MKLSLMTMSMFMKMYMKYQIDHDMDELIETYEEMMHLITETEYQAVDITSIETALFTTESVKNILYENNLSVSSYIYFGAFADMDEAGVRERIEDAKNAVDTAINLDTEVLMLVPTAGKDIEKYSPTSIRRQMIKHWIPVVEYAKSRGIHVVIEDTPDLKLHLCRAEDLREVLDAVPGIEVVYDSGNMILAGEDPVEYFEQFVEKTAYIHLKDMRIASDNETLADLDVNGKKMKAAPIGTGLIDLNAVIYHIKNSGYQGFVSTEFMVDASGDYRESLIRSKCFVDKLNLAEVFP